MQGRFSMVLAGVALAVGGGVAGAVVVAPSMRPDAGSVAVRQAAGKDALATPQHTFQVAKKARGMARGARQLANSLVDQVGQAQADASQALTQSSQALTQSSQALTQSSQALTTAENTQSRLNSTQVASRTESGTVTTAEENDWVQLGGPQVTVDVPASGLIEVGATVRFQDPIDGMVALFEDGQQVPLQQDQFCTGGPPLDDALLVAQLGSGVGDITLSTPPATLFGLGCGTFGSAAAPMIFNRPPGTHTYELRYADCGCDPGDATFSNRTLRVGPRL